MFVRWLENYCTVLSVLCIHASEKGGGCFCVFPLPYNCIKSDYFWGRRVQGTCGSQPLAQRKPDWSTCQTSARASKYDLTLNLAADNYAEQAFTDFELKRWKKNHYMDFTVNSATNNNTEKGFNIEHNHL